MAGLSDNLFLDPLLGQPFLRAEREHSHDKLFAPIAVALSELNISPLGLAVILCLVKSKGPASLLSSSLATYLSRMTLGLSSRKRSSSLRAWRLANDKARELGWIA